MNNVTIVGRICNEIDLRFIAGSGKAVAKFTVVVNRNMAQSKREELRAQGKPTSDFIRVIVWGKGAEILANNASKGTLIAVKGEITTGSYKDKEGKTVYTTEVTANTFNGFDILSWEKKEDLGMKADKFEDGFKELEIDEQIPF